MSKAKVREQGVHQIMKIIDSHVHLHRTSAQTVGNFSSYMIQDPIRYRAELEEAGICHVCGSVIDGEIPGAGRKNPEIWQHIHELNETARTLSAELSDGAEPFYTPGFHVHPNFVRESCDEIASIHEEGYRLIGELVPYMHGWYDYDSKAMKEILDTAEQFHMTVSFHSTGYEFTRMVEDHPGLTFIAAHPGEKPQMDRHIERMKQFPNLYLDLSGTGLFRFGMLRYLVDAVGSERILFGTDYPICNPRMYVQAVYGEHLADEDLQNIFHRNAERIFGLPQTD